MCCRSPPARYSGAYFGDKLSPLSDTTILAPTQSIRLFSHIRNMAWTTLPSLLIALGMFTTVGLLGQAPSGEATSAGMAATLEAQFNPAWYLLLPMVLVFTLAFRRFPAYPTILVGALVGLVFAVLFNPDRVVALAGNGRCRDRWRWYGA